MRTAQDFIVEIPVLNFNERMTKARQVLRDDRFREVYVVDKRENLLGYLDITDGLRVTATRSNVTVEGFVKEAPAVHGGDSIEAVAAVMREYRTDSAAVVNSEPRIIGGILLADLFPVIISRNRLRGEVADLMTRRVVSAAPDDPVQKVHALVLESGYSTFPVVKKKDLVGIISRRDLISARKVRAAIAQHGQATVESVMKRDVFTVAPGDPLDAAAGLLVARDVSLLPVVDEGVMVGVLNRHDVLRALA